MRYSLYWDDFHRRAKETVEVILTNKELPIRRVSVFVTNRCNFRCRYCNVAQSNQTLTEKDFINVLEKYGKTAIIHITGGEPSLVPWLYPLIKDYGERFRFFISPASTKSREITIA